MCVTELKKNIKKTQILYVQKLSVLCAVLIETLASKGDIVRANDTKRDSSAIPPMIESISKFPVTVSTNPNNEQSTVIPWISSNTPTIKPSKTNSQFPIIPFHNIQPSAPFAIPPAISDNVSMCNPFDVLGEIPGVLNSNIDSMTQHSQIPVFDSLDTFGDEVTQTNQSQSTFNQGFDLTNKYISTFSMNPSQDVTGTDFVTILAPLGAFSFSS